MAKRMAQDERANPNPSRRRGRLRETDHRFVGDDASTRPLDEDMIHRPHGVKSDLLRQARLARDVGQ